jgi:hypothetical protein
MGDLMTTFQEAMEKMILVTVEAAKVTGDFTVMLHVYRGSAAHPVSLARAIRSTQRHTRRQRIINTWRQG